MAIKNHLSWYIVSAAALHIIFRPGKKISFRHVQRLSAEAPRSRRVCSDDDKELPSSFLIAPPEIGSLLELDVTDALSVVTCYLYLFRNVILK